MWSPVGSALAVADSKLEQGFLEPLHCSLRIFRYMASTGVKATSQCSFNKKNNRDRPKSPLNELLQVDPCTRRIDGLLLQVFTQHKLICIEVSLYSALTHSNVTFFHCKAQRSFILSGDQPSGQRRRARVQNPSLLRRRQSVPFHQQPTVSYVTDECVWIM